VSVLLVVTVVVFALATGALGAVFPAIGVAPGACATKGRERVAEISTRNVAFSEGISL
jgi:hypothetical protein